MLYASVLMCGIAGVVALVGDPSLGATARAMARTIAHRGPDGEGLFTAPGGRAALVHRRLAIIDVSTGAQPMASTEQSLTIVFNGEIYNYAELRDGYAARGYAFANRSDTEAILAALVKDGPSGIEKLRGMFAFAVWDEGAQRLLLARDRFGKKPLYYAVEGGRLYFASEMKALLAVLPAVTDDRIALAQYLTMGYVPGERTAFREIRRVPPGHTLTFDAQGVRLQRYWELPFPDETTLRHESVEALAERFHDRLDESVRLRLVSEVPLGAFLSGGLDSSTVVALCLKHVRPPFHTFSIRGDDPNEADATAAREVARLLGTTHHEHVVTAPKPDDLEALLAQYDEPFADSSLVPTAAVSRAAREHVTVALSGDGGDELFGGYGVYRTYARLRPLARMPLLGSVSALARDRWPRGVPGAATLDCLAVPRGELLPRLVAHFWGDELALLGFEEAERRRAHDELRESFARGPTGASPVAEAQWFDASRAYLAGDILPKVDIASMATSLEVRCPLLDHKLAEDLAALPAHARMKGPRGKLVLRRIAERYLPKHIIERKKHGFSVPLGRWLEGPLAPMVEAYVRDPRGPLSDVCDVRAMTTALGPRLATQPRLVFTLLSLAAFRRRRAAAIGPRAAA